MNLDYTEPLAGTDWRVASTVTPALTIHAIFRPSTPPIGFGANELDGELVAELIHSIEQTTIPTTSFHATQLSIKVNGFDRLVAVQGRDRHFLNGWWIDQPDFIHVFPVYSCELAADNLFPYERTRTYLNVFDLKREPEPYFQFQMQGGPSKLRVQDWGYASLSELRTFISILKTESESRLLIKNREGKILELPDAFNGWRHVDVVVRSHLV